jgi:hypothetical protein
MRAEAHLVAGEREVSITSTEGMMDSSSAMRPSMKDWRSRAAWYSAFSDRSPCARASAMARITPGAPRLSAA